MTILQFLRKSKNVRGRKAAVSQKIGGGRKKGKRENYAKKRQENFISNLELTIFKEMM